MGACELLVAEGPLKGRRFAAGAAGMRLGRSSSCEISVPDPSLSRNHCLFEVRDGALWITDLASANGTEVNGAPLGVESRRLAAGDRVTAGETVVDVVAPADAPDAPPSDASAAAPEAAPTIDLGLGKSEWDVPPPANPAKRLALWTVAILAVGLAGFVILTGADGEAAADGAASGGAAPARAPAAEEKGLRGFTFEKVEAGPQGIYRYALAYDGDGSLAVEIDDVPKSNHVRKTAKLEAAARKRLEEIFAGDALFRLDREYAGEPLEPGTLKSFALRVVRPARVFGVTIENSPEPEAFRAVREKLETFSKNELGMWAIQYPVEQLVKMAEEARRAGDAKWEERDVQHGNVSAALRAYEEALFYLDTVNPKPAWHGALAARRREAAGELDTRWRNQRFQADRAINLGDWEAALRELRVLCEMVPDAKDPRHSEARAKLLDVEGRMKKARR